MKSRTPEPSLENGGMDMLWGKGHPPTEWRLALPRDSESLRWKAVVTIVLVFLMVMIFCLHRGGYWLIKCSLPPDVEMSFVAAAGEQGYTIDLATYGAAIRETFRSPSLFRGDPYYVEHRDQYLPKGAACLALAGLPMALTGDVENAFWWGQLIPIGASVLFVWMLVGMSGEKRGPRELAILAFVVPWLFLANGSLVLLKRMLRTLFSADLPAIRDFWYLGRFPFIEVAIVFLLLWLVCLAHFLSRPSRRSALMLGGALALLQYSYFYHITGALVMTACCVVLPWPSWHRWKLITVAAGTYMVLIVPFVINMVNFLKAPTHADFVLNSGRQVLGPLRPHLWMFALVIVLLAVDYGYLVLVRREVISVSKLLQLSSLQLGLFVAYIVVMNIQVVLGWTMQPVHWKVAFYMPVWGALLGVYLSRASSVVGVMASHGFLRLVTAGLVVGAIVIGVAGAGTASVFASQWGRAFMVPASEANVLRFIKEECPDAVIASNSLRLNLEIAAKVGNPVLFGNAVLSVCGADELIRRFVLGFRAAGYDRAMIEEQLTLGEDWVPTIREWRRHPQLRPNEFFSKMLENRCSLVLLGDRRFSVKGGGHRVSPEVIREIEALCQFSFAELAGSFRLDFVVLDKRIIPSPEVVPVGEIVYENGDFIVAKFQPNRRESVQAVVASTRSVR